MISAKTVLFFEDLDCKEKKGYIYAKRAYEGSVEMKTDRLIVKELPWGTKVVDDMCDKVRASENYYIALTVIGEYVNIK